MHALIKKLKIIACICITFIHFCPDVHADDLLNEKTDKTTLLDIANPIFPKADRNSEFHLFLNTKDKTDNEFEINYVPFAFEYHNWFLPEEKPKKVSFGTVFKLALDEFDFLSGVKEVVNVTKGKLDNYRKDLYLTGGVVFEKKNYKPKNFIQELRLQKVDWSFDIDPNEKEASGRLEFGEYFTLTGNIGDDSEFTATVKFDF